jgi:PcfJ-like protein
MKEIIDYAIHLNASSEVMNWLDTAGKKALQNGRTTISELEHVLDYMVSDSSPARLQKMSIADAKRKASEWSKTNQKKGKGLVDTSDDIEVIHDFLDGTKIVKLKSKKAYKREGFLMSHCVGGYVPENDDCHIYSYRDAKNNPHATFEVKKSRNEILQIKGRGNGTIHPKYIHPILAFLKSVGMNIKPNDMINIGYYHIAKENLEFLNSVVDANNQFVVINGETYAF